MGKSWRKSLTSWKKWFNSQHSLCLCGSLSLSCLPILDWLACSLCYSWLPYLGLLNWQVGEWWWWWWWWWWRWQWWWQWWSPGGDDDNGRAAAGEAKLLLDGQELATAAPEHLRMMGLLLDQHLNIWTYGEHLRTMGEADTGWTSEHLVKMK